MANVLKLLDYHRKKDDFGMVSAIYIFAEYCDGNLLDSIVKKRPLASGVLLLKIARDVAMGLDGLHKVLWKYC